LQWNASTHNVTVAGYDVYCGTLQVGSTKWTSYHVTGLNPNTDYTFTVRAWDADGNTSAASRPLAVSTPLPPDLVYLSQLRWASATTGFGSVGKDQSVDGNPIRLRGTAYARGLGTHASSEIVYDLSKLGKTYARFVSDVGIDSEISQGGSVVFQVYADDEKRFDSGVMTAASAVRTVNVRIGGTKRLRLVVTDGGDGINSDHADWAGARLAGGGSH
jgi:chitodextrinase